MTIKKKAWELDVWPLIPKPLTGEVSGVFSKLYISQSGRSFIYVILLGRDAAFWLMSTVCELNEFHCGVIVQEVP